MNAGVLTASTKGFAGEREDLSGKILCEILQEAGYTVADYRIVPDDSAVISSALIEMCQKGASLILTTGGTGFAKTDVTPEATLQIATRNAPGIAEALRAYSCTITPRAMLSRAVAVLRDDTLVVNLPGSPRAVRECAQYLLPNVEHGLKILLGQDGECAR